MFAKETEYLKLKLKQVIGKYPSLYFPLANLKKESIRNKRVTNATDIVIDGFPRSANSFAVGAFEYSQNKTVDIAHHLHVPAQIIRGCELNVPTVLLIRNPVDTIISYHALLMEDVLQAKSEALLNLGFRPFFELWIDFYRGTIDYTDGYVIGTFTHVTKNFGDVVHLVNDKFGTSFERFEHDSKVVEIINSKRGRHAGPSDEREKYKEQVKERFHAESSKFSGLVKEAMNLYSTYKQKACV
ncbi:hypothetical protein GGP79_001129 [Salinibacter ruber]|jgi:hypothetical protein|uniref:hypothetical protein n=1 Tax=Salinibacter ruber TaxID=146919 RepID=UPI002168121C|nr:hypothetical protein [Salinibacter ruber]MCS3753184.1 hypothetical protein [Salinibacter ruber]